MASNTPVIVRGLFTFQVDRCCELIRTGSSKSDPYVSITYGRKELHRTPAIGNTQHPVWKDSVQIFLEGKVLPTQPFTFTVWDSEVIMSVFNGKADIMVKDVVAGGLVDGTFPLVPDPRHEEDQADTHGAGDLGTIAVNVQYEKMVAAPEGVKSLNIENFKLDPISGILEIAIIRGKDLKDADIIGKSDPFVRVKLGKFQLVETQVIDNTLFPVWHFKETIVLTGVLTDETVIDVNVRDYDSVKISEDIGALAIPFKELLRKGFIGGEFQLYIREKKKILKKGFLEAAFRWKPLDPGAEPPRDLKHVDVGDLQAKEWRKEGHKDYTK
eukprot:CAMPEP_0174892346 /NCGR_PEP_ID=MMETSP0167-20121228/7304_1 /TAXON_ID=38298 /ORGANISM="Rhodella maculata, Strain CCMP736" /LENGTH=326 /DNA_ID=CAMNT_0016130809 /DNA_START=17 /DNA_END=997 /DNA_ORIENTATION=-